MTAAIKPTRKELHFEDHEIMVSKTDLEWRITYVNRTFMKLADYPEKVLLGRKHKIIRHPDVPRGLILLMKKTLAQGEEFLGYFKNITSKGDFFWVFASITPDWDARGEVVGYHHVRRKADAGVIETIDRLYRDMLAAESDVSSVKGVEDSLAVLTRRLDSDKLSYDKFVLSL